MALLYHMCIPWQWAAWAVWTLALPVLILTGHWFGALGPLVGIVFYVLPAVLFAAALTTMATWQTRHTYAEPRTPRVLLGRMGRVLPYLIVNTGMIAHQFSAVIEGLFGAMHGEFERTPKAASTGAGPVVAKRYRVKIHWSYVLAEAFFVGYQLAAAVLLFDGGLAWSALGAMYLAGCVLYIALYYGDDAGRRMFVIDWVGLRSRRRRPAYAAIEEEEILMRLPG
ncbi:hypothetical protein [Mycobacterium sp. C31M]